MRAWGRLGYPRRAQRLHAASVLLVAEHGGDVPDDEAALRRVWKHKIEPLIKEYFFAAPKTAEQYTPGEYWPSLK